MSMLRFLGLPAHFRGRKNIRPEDELIIDENLNGRAGYRLVFDAPTVRHIQGAPVGVVEPGLPPPQRIAAMKPSAGFEIDFPQRGQSFAGPA